MAAIMLAATAAGSIGATIEVKASSIVEPGTTTTGSLTIHKKNASDKYTAADEEEGNIPAGSKVGDAKPLDGAGFTVYKIMDLTAEETPGEYASFAVTRDFANGVLKDLDKDTLGNYTASEIEALSSALLKEIADNTIAGTPKITGADAAGSGAAKFTGLTMGYYFVVETSAPEGAIAAKPFFIAVPSTYEKTEEVDGEDVRTTWWEYNVSVTPKNDVLKPDKTITNAKGNHENTTSANSNKDTVAEGDIVDFVVGTTIPQYADEYFAADNKPKLVITDVMSDGLQICKENGDPYQEIVVTVDGVKKTAGDDYTITITNAEGDAPDLTVTFVSDPENPNDVIKNNGGKRIEISYSAKVTSAAVVGTQGNTNKVTVSYTNQPNSTELAELPPATTIVYTYNLQLQKTDETGKNGLGGAKFALYTKLDEDGKLIDANKVGEATTSNDSGDKGLLTFERLDAGTYWLKEIESPSGYTLLTNPIKITITADTTTETGLTGKIGDFAIDGVSVTEDEAVKDDKFQSYFNKEANTGIVTIAVENKKGFTLPDTGGMGIAVFLAVGLVGIAAVSIMMMKKRKEQ